MKTGNKDPSLGNNFYKYLSQENLDLDLLKNTLLCKSNRK